MFMLVRLNLFVGKQRLPASRLAARRKPADWPTGHQETACRSAAWPPRNILQAGCLAWACRSAARLPRNSLQARAEKPAGLA